MPSALDMLNAYEGLQDHSITEYDYWAEKNNSFYDEYLTLFKAEADRALKAKTALVVLIDKGVVSDEASKRSRKQFTVVGGRGR